MVDKIIENLEFGFFTASVFSMAIWFVFSGYPTWIRYLERRDKLDRDAETERRKENSRNLDTMTERDNLLQSEICKVEKQIGIVQGQISNLTTQFNAFSKEIIQEMALTKLSLKDIKKQKGIDHRHYDLPED